MYKNGDDSYRRRVEAGVRVILSFHVNKIAKNVNKSA